MTIEEIIRHYPRLYHMANHGTWDSISRRGLLSTSALLDLFQINGNERYRIESCHRPNSIEIGPHPVHGTAIIRDQRPMNERVLGRSLEGIGIREWYELLNRKAFFWMTEGRVQTLLKAKLYRDYEHVVITVDTASLLAQHGDRAALSPINSGSTIYNPPKRGQYTFLSIAEYPFVERRKRRGIANAVAELAVDYSVPDLLAHTITVERRKDGRVLGTIYSRTTGERLVHE